MPRSRDICTAVCTKRVLASISSCAFSIFLSSFLLQKLHILVCLYYGEASKVLKSCSCFWRLESTGFTRLIHVIMSVRKKFDLQYKVIVIGESAVGKSSLIRRYASPDQPFETNMVSTVGIDFVNVDTKVDDLTLRLQIWDTAGQERFRTLTTNQFRGTKGALLVFDITSATTFDNLKFWLESIKKNNLLHEEFIIIGNKSDLIDEREVPKRKGEALAKFHGVKYVETSAKSGKNVKEVFYSLATQMKDANDPFVYIRQNDITDGVDSHESKHDIIRPSAKDDTTRQKHSGYSSCCAG